jgi:hypothetical protein
MNELVAPDIGYGLVALALVVLYAAWHEYAAKNQRDARLLALLGSAGLAGNAAVWLT